MSSPILPTLPKEPPLNRFKSKFILSLVRSRKMHAHLLLPSQSCFLNSSFNSVGRPGDKFMLEVIYCSNLTIKNSVKHFKDYLLPSCFVSRKLTWITSVRSFFPIFREILIKRLS